MGTLSLGVRGEDGEPLAVLVLDERDRQVVFLRGVDGPVDIGQRLLARRILDLQGGGKVLVLQLNDDQGAAWSSHGKLLLNRAVLAVVRPL